MLKHNFGRVALSILAAAFQFSCTTARINPPLDIYKYANLRLTVTKNEVSKAIGVINDITSSFHFSRYVVAPTRAADPHCGDSLRLDNSFICYLFSEGDSHISTLIVQQREIENQTFLYLSITRTKSAYTVSEALFSKIRVRLSEELGTSKVQYLAPVVELRQNN